MLWIRGKNGQLINLAKAEIIDAYKNGGKYELRVYMSDVFCDVLAEYETEAHARGVINHIWELLRTKHCTLNISTLVTTSLMNPSQEPST